ncbi:MAG TPA: glycoside hydrolase family 99-like domain-containing protein, partial [Armatimonadota bacterium]|nr:glycoside hydrolase family 99-like domain-containing protein [Armatimonadota bacterium]
MNRRDLVRGLSAAALAGPAAAKAPEARRPEIEVAAYYFPNYHPDARNDRWHGKGWTEWELVKAARPRYPGHQQPKVPQWGHFDESDPEWAAREIDLAADHGVTAFLYDWYWYEDGPYLQDGLEKGFLQAPNNRRMRFGLMWANHDWLNIHPAPFVNHPETLAKGRVSRAAFERLTDHV